MQSGIIFPTYISTKAQLADIFTKIVPVAQHHLLLSKLGVHNIFSPPSLRRSEEGQVGAHSRACFFQWYIKGGK